MTWKLEQIPNSKKFLDRFLCYYENLIVSVFVIWSYFVCTSQQYHVWVGWDAFKTFIVDCTFMISTPNKKNLRIAKSNVSCGFFPLTQYRNCGLFHTLNTTNWQHFYTNLCTIHSYLRKESYLHRNLRFQLYLCNWGSNRRSPKYLFIKI